MDKTKMKKVETFASIFGDDYNKEPTEKADGTTPLKLADLLPVRNHPFKLYEGERFNDMVESIYILLALSKELMSGYDLTRTIYNLTKGRLEVKTGTMYPTQKRLSEHQLEDQSQERNKKIYQLTNEGKQLLQWEVDLLNEKINEVKSIMNKT